jgi:phage baseplate assembly protein W
MSTELLVPFALGTNGQVAITTDPDTQTGQHVNALISTRPGERAMLPAYGVDLAGQVFGNADEVATAIINDVQVAMQQWEPTVTVINVSTAPGLDQVTGLAQIEVDYTASPSGAAGNAVSTATVLVGGTVVEQVSP